MSKLKEAYQNFLNSGGSTRGTTDHLLAAIIEHLTHEEKPIITEKVQEEVKTKKTNK